MPLLIERSLPCPILHIPAEIVVIRLEQAAAQRAHIGSPNCVIRSVLYVGGIPRQAVLQPLRQVAHRHQFTRFAASPTRVAHPALQACRIVAPTGVEHTAADLFALGDHLPAPVVAPAGEVGAIVLHLGAHPFAIQQRLLVVVEILRAATHTIRIYH